MLLIMKRRIGWAKVGRDASPTVGRCVHHQSHFLGIPSATLPSTANSPDLKPEFTTETEIEHSLAFQEKSGSRCSVVRQKLDQSNCHMTPASSGYGAKVTNFERLN
jgi:hypothetical protein